MCVRLCMCVCVCLHYQHVSLSLNTSPYPILTFPGLTDPCLEKTSSSSTQTSGQTLTFNPARAAAAHTRTHTLLCDLWRVALWEHIDFPLFLTHSISGEKGSPAVHNFHQQPDKPLDPQRNVTLAALSRPTGLRFPCRKKKQKKTPGRPQNNKSFRWIRVNKIS